MATKVEQRVVVVGGGPVGLVAALSLAHRGIDTLVLEASTPDVQREWRGSTLHPPTLEILDQFDLADEVVAGATRVQRLQYRDLELDEQATFDYGVLAGTSPYPHRWQFEQYKLLRLLRREVERSAKIEVRYENAVVGLEQSGGGVRVDVSAAHGSLLSVTSPWVVAADGAHSTVRKLLGIEFPGWTYPRQSLVVATPFAFEAHVPDLGEVAYFSGPGGRVSLIRTPDIWRVALSTDTAVDAADTPYTADNPHPAYVAGMQAVVGNIARPGSGPLALEQHQLYRSHQRVAATFHLGRVVLLGDAAHLSSTTGGMGLNSGVHDAWELAPALVADASDSTDRIAAYAERRRQVAVEVVQPTTTRTRTTADEGDVDVRRDRILHLREIAADESRAREYLRSMSMLETVVTT